MDVCEKSMFPVLGTNLWWLDNRSMALDNRSMAFCQISDNFIVFSCRDAAKGVKQLFVGEGKALLKFLNFSGEHLFGTY